MKYQIKVNDRYETLFKLPTKKLIIYYLKKSKAHYQKLGVL